MKDRQISRKQELGRIPVLSPVLHVLCMPVLVALRHDFGFQFLRPKSIFLALIWAFLLFAIYSKSEPERWRSHSWVCAFFAVASILYLFHLTRAMSSQWGNPPHDQYAGRTLLVPFRKLEWKTFLIVEPAVVAVVATLMHFVPSSGLLSDLLFIVAGAMVAKEAINQWGKKRKENQLVDITKDADDSMKKVVEKREWPTWKWKQKASSSRKPRKSRERNRNEPDPKELEEQHAVVLRMMPPYVSEQAEQNYRGLVREFHPDEENQSEADQRAMVALTEARDFFRGHLQDS